MSGVGTLREKTTAYLIYRLSVKFNFFDLFQDSNPVTAECVIRVAPIFGRVGLDGRQASAAVAAVEPTQALQEEVQEVIRSRQQQRLVQLVQDYLVIETFIN